MAFLRVLCVKAFDVLSIYDDRNRKTTPWHFPLIGFLDFKPQAAGRNMFQDRVLPQTCKPLAQSDSLTLWESKTLHKAVVSILARALECCFHLPAKVNDDNRKSSIVKKARKREEARF